MSEIKVEERYIGYLFDEFSGNRLKFVVARNFRFYKIRVKVKNFGAIFFEKIVFEPSKLKILESFIK